MKKSVRLFVVMSLLIGGMTIFQTSEVSARSFYSRFQERFGSQNRETRPVRRSSRFSRQTKASVSQTAESSVAPTPVETQLSSSCTCEAKVKPATVMTLEKFNVEPKGCPSGWKQAGYGIDWSDGGKNSYARTCYTSRQCSVMHLEIFNGTPNTCPSGWTEADFGKKWVDGGQSKFRRTCYVCA